MIARLDVVFCVTTMPFLTTVGLLHSSKHLPSLAPLFPQQSFSLGSPHFRIYSRCNRQNIPCCNYFHLYIIFFHTLLFVPTTGCESTSNILSQHLPPIWPATTTLEQVITLINNYIVEVLRRGVFSWEFDQQQLNLGICKTCTCVFQAPLMVIYLKLKISRRSKDEKLEEGASHHIYFLNHHCSGVQQSNRCSIIIWWKSWALRSV